MPNCFSTFLNFVLILFCLKIYTWEQCICCICILSTPPSSSSLVPWPQLSSQIHDLIMFVYSHTTATPIHTHTQPTWAHLLLPWFACVQTWLFRIGSQPLGEKRKTEKHTKKQNKTSDFTSLGSHWLPVALQLGVGSVTQSPVHANTSFLQWTALVSLFAMYSGSNFGH